MNVIEVAIVLCVTAVSCGLIGSMLVLKDQSMLADALSHSVLLGIVLGFFVSNSLDSPLLQIGACVFGVATVMWIDRLASEKKLTHDAATGIVFPFLFAVSIILISMFARNVHLDIDMVLMGEVIFVPFNRIEWGGMSFPVAFLKSGVVCFFNLLFVWIGYRRLGIVLFDETYADIAGIAVRKWKLVTMLLVSLTIVVSFDSVGSIAVICFMVAPSMTVMGWCKHYIQLLIGSVIVSIATACIGYAAALQLDVTVSGMCTVMALIVCLGSIFIRSVYQKKSRPEKDAKEKIKVP